jgi:hypothetical protein
LSRRGAFLAAALAAALAPGPARGDDAGAVATPEDAGASIAGCVERIPRGMARPLVRETFPRIGTSGWAAALRITVTHGKGERVLPAGLDLAAAGDAKKLLRQHGFAIPEPDGGASAQLHTEPDDKAKPLATTNLELPLVLLPEKPGRNVMELPPLPIAIARANGEIATVCTSLHTILVEDPIADVPEAEPRENPPPRSQREEWTALKRVALWGGLGIIGGVILAYLLWRHLSRPKPPPPPPPPRPPWEVALERLDEVRHAGLLDALRYTEYFDRVSDAVRGYLGARFGFDGLESTTDEILVALEKHGGGFVRMDSGEELSGPAPGIPLATIRALLQDCDLVKFANLTPTPSQCAAALENGEAIVRGTMPGAAPPRPEAPGPEAPPPTPPGEAPRE